MGDPINVYLAQEGIKAEEFLQGKGVQQAAQRFKVENLLAIHFKRVQGKPYMEVRFFALPQHDPAVSTAFFVPPSIRSAGAAGARFSGGGGPANPPQAKQRSLLARLLGGDLEAGSYSSGEGTIPLRQVARFTFPVLAMDVAVAPADRIPRLVVSDGDQIYMYKIVEQRIEPEWTKSVRFLGRTISVQLADVDGDGTLEVVGNRYNERVGMNSFVIAVRNGKPTFLVENVDDFLFAVDLKGDGVKQTLWTQRYSRTAFFTPGQADQVIIKNGKIVVEKSRPRATGLPAHGGRLQQYRGEGHSLARLHRRIQPAPGLHGGRGAMAVLHIRGRRLHGGRAGSTPSARGRPSRSPTRSRPLPWPSTWTGMAWRSSSFLRTR